MCTNTHRKGHVNGIHDSPVLKENADNDIDKTVYTLMKHAVLNEDSTYYHLESDQLQVEKKSQSDIDRHLNNSLPSSLSDSQISGLQTPIRDKNALCELDETVSSSARTHTTMQDKRDLEVAVAVNNERHRTHSEIEAQVDNNLADDGVFDDTSHHNNNSDLSPVSLVDVLAENLSQDHSEKNSGGLSPCFAVSFQQQPDASKNWKECPSQLPSDLQLITVASSQPKKQSDPDDRNKCPLQDDSEHTCINNRSPQSASDSTGDPKYHSDKGSIKDFFSCNVVSPQPAQQPVTVKEKKHRKYRKKCHRQRYRHRKVKYLKRRKREKHPKHMLQQCCRKCEPPYPRPPKSKGPASRNNDNAPANKRSTNTERQNSCGRHKCLGKQGNLFQANTQRVGSPGGNDEKDDDKDGDKEPYPGGRNFHTQRKDLNMVLCLLIVLLILCFCFPRLEDTPQPALYTESSTCAIGRYQTTSQDLNSPFQDLSSNDCTTALCRGGFISRVRETDGEDSTSSSTFPGGNSTDHLVSEEETPRLVGQGEEIAGIKKLHPRRKLTERPHHTPPAHPRPQLDLDCSQENILSLTSPPKLFTCPSPDTDIHEMSHDYAESPQCHEYNSSVGGHMMIFHSKCAFKSPKLGPNPNVPHFLTETNIHQCQQSPPLHYVTVWSNADSSSTTPEDEEEENDDPPAIFRGPGTAYKKPPDHNEGRTLDSGVGTNSSSNQIPATQTPAVAAAKIDTSWRTSLNQGKLVYLRPGTEDSSFQFVLSEEEQTPWSPNYRDELVGVKAFNQRDNLEKQPANVPLSQPPEPLIEPGEQSLLLLKPSMEVFPYLSPDPDEDFQDVPGDLCVFIGGSALYTSRMLTSSVMSSVLTDDTIGQSQRYPLQYFTT